MPKVSSGQVGPEDEDVMDPEPNLSPDSVHLKNESVKKQELCKCVLTHFNDVIIFEFDVSSDYLQCLKFSLEIYS